MEAVMPVGDCPQSPNRRHTAPSTWVRRALYVALASLFIVALYRSFSRLSARKLAVAQTTRTSPTLFYPSVTMCQFYSLESARRPTYNTAQEAVQLRTPISRCLNALRHNYRTVENNSLLLNWTNYHEHKDKLFVRVVHNINMGFSGLQTCITYEPPGPSEIGFDHGLKLDLKQSNEIDFWLVTLHNKGHFVPGWGRTFGSTYVVSKSGSSKKWFSSFDVSKGGVKCVSDGEVRCHPAPDDSSDKPADIDFDACLEQYVLRQTGCAMPWMKAHSSEPGGATKAECRSRVEHKRYLEAMNRAMNMGEQALAEEAGCLASCTRSFYNARLIISDANYTDPTLPPTPDNSSNIQLAFFYTSNTYMQEEQYLAYNLDSLIADFGGYLGLLLGHSILSFYDLGLGFLKKFSCCFGAGERKVSDHRQIAA